MNDVHAVIFDLDGTLVRSELDFNSLRAQLGIESGPVWETILAMAPADREHAEGKLLEFELEGARGCGLMPNAMETLDALAAMALQCGILTRNCRQAADIAIGLHGIDVASILAREDGLMKPDPGGVIKLAGRLGVEPQHILVVGDYVFDIQAGRRAGSLTALYVHKKPKPEYADIADYVIDDLREVVRIVEEHRL